MLQRRLVVKKAELKAALLAASTADYSVALRADLTVALRDVLSVDETVALMVSSTAVMMDCEWVDSKAEL